MCFCNRKRQAVSVPDLTHYRLRTRQAFCTYSDRLDICVCMTSVAAMRSNWISGEALIKKTLAGNVMINPQKVRWGLVLQKPLQFAGLYSCLLYTSDAAD